MADPRKKSDGEGRRARERGEGVDDPQIPQPVLHRAEAYPDPVDDTLDDSFPASDPPQWWGGDDAS